MTDPNADTGNASNPADAVPLDTIRQWGQELGFQALGFTGIDLAQHRDYLAKWLEAGYHGEMEWMASHGQKRTHPLLHSLEGSTARTAIRASGS